MNETIRKKITADCGAYADILLRVWRNFQHVPGKRANAGLSPQELSIMAESIKTLSSGLTGERELIGSRYLSDPDMLGAYLLYFWQMSYLQARHALALLPFKPKMALDLGCGPGPVSMALNDLGASVTGADYSKDALSLARSIAAEAGKTMRFLPWDAVKNTIPDGWFDCIVFSHVLNELWSGEDRTELRTDLVEKASESLTDNGMIVVIEPALLEISRDTLRIRDELAQRGFFITYPCTGNYSCPALLTDTGMCHTAFEYERPALLESIVKKAGFKKDALKMTVFLFSRKKPSISTNSYRVVSDMMETKNGRLRFLICGNGERISLSCAKSDRNSASSRLRSLRRGDLISIQNAEKRENGFGITEATVIV